jgi:hypothetical protein
MNNNHNIKKRVQVMYFLLFTLPGLSLIGNYTSTSGDNFSSSPNWKVVTHTSFVKLNTAMDGHHQPEKYVYLRFRCGVNEKSYIFSNINERHSSNNNYDFTPGDVQISNRVKSAIILSLRHILLPGFLSSYSFRPPPVFC